MLRIRLPKSPGFSLLEVLVAMSLLGLVFLIAAALLNGATRNSEYVERNDPFPEDLPVFDVLMADLRHFSRVPLQKPSPALALEENRLEFRADLPAAGLSSLSYEATEDGVQRILSPLDQSLPGQTNLLHESDSWIVQVFREEEWEDSWPPESGQGTPALLGVEVDGERREVLLPASFELRSGSEEEEDETPAET